MDNHPIIRISIGFNNKFLVKIPNSSEYILVDTGYAKEFDKFKKILDEEWEIKLDQIKYIFLTHHHDDHAGFLAQLLQNIQAKVICHEKAPKQLKKGKSNDSVHPVNRRIAFMIKLFMLFHRDFTFPPVDLNSSQTIIPQTYPNSSIFESIGIPATIYYTPGHTFDGISLIMDNGNVFCGDNAMNTKLFQFLGIKYRPIFLENSDEIFQNWKTYMKNGGKTIYPAHGDPFDIEELKKAIKTFRPELIE